MSYVQMNSTLLEKLEIIFFAVLTKESSLAILFIFDAPFFEAENVKLCKCCLLRPLLKLSIRFLATDLIFISLLFIKNHTIVWSANQ